MDSKRFDDLSRLLSRGSSRRGALKAALGALVGAGALAAGLDDAAATKPLRGRPFRSTCTNTRQCRTPLVCQRDRRFSRTERNRCGCNFGETWCPELNQCVTLGTEGHCNFCGDACGSIEGCCVNGEANACIETVDSFANCGGCGIACDPETADNCDFDECLCGDESACVNGEICVSGVCESPVASCEPADGADGCFVGVDGATIQVCDGTVIDAECDTAAECTAACAAANIPLPECGCTVGFNDGTGFISADSLTGGALTKAGICGVYLPFDGTCAPPPG